MRYFFIAFIILIITYKPGLSQNQPNSGWETLFSDNSKDLFVQITVTTMKDSCGNGSTYTHKFMYKIRPSSVPHPYFVSWKMDYLDCDGNPYCQERSIEIQPNQDDGKQIENMDYLFSSSKILKPHYDAAISTTLKQSTKPLIIQNSIAPVSIEGDNNIYLGQSSTLTVKGGALGIGADWFWYKSQCGIEQIGKGETIKVKPTDSTTYFVRAEGKNNTTLCAQINVNVDKRSTSANGISAETKICKGDTNELTVQGGSLGVGAEWVWYTDDCKGKKIGTGKTIAVHPKVTTDYYVRAEGDLNTTDCASIKIEVFDKSLNPAFITASGSTTICEGGTIKLKVNGGLLSNGAVWKWYSGTCNDISLDTGIEAEFSPLSSTTYFVRGEGLCNKTNCVSLPITVNDKSYNPEFITKPSEVFKNKKTTLTVSGGSLGKDAKWQWFKNSCGSGKPIGIGTSITVRTRKPTTYYVNAKGNCNETSCVQTTINPSKTHHWDKMYASKQPKFLQLGFGIGIEWQQFSEIGMYSTTGNGTPSLISSTKIRMNGIGGKAEMVFHPFIKDYLSIGFIPGYAIGISPIIFSKDDGIANSTTEEDYFYQRFQLETELAFGYGPVKLLFKWKRSFQSNDYQKTVTTYSTHKTEYTFNGNVNKETINAGFRLGRYEHKDLNYYKRGNNFDIIYTLSRNHPDDIIAFSPDDYQHISDWNVGAGFTWWRQSALKFQFEIVLKSTQDEFSFDSNDFKDASYLVTLVYNRNWFY